MGVIINVIITIIIIFALISKLLVYEVTRAIKK